ncbi:hypothetical protein D1007_07133 [Hordeum vulgare]|nr:hypothetical protein D1007_62470 [Hordeum vulgare]KAE8815652.1 hypothetical protein D1007_07133 [Hordeum vulgare]
MPPPRRERHPRMLSTPATTKVEQSFHLQLTKNPSSQQPAQQTVSELVDHPRPSHMTKHAGQLAPRQCPSDSQTVAGHHTPLQPHPCSSGHGRLISTGAAMSSPMQPPHHRHRWEPPCSHALHAQDLGRVLESAPRMPPTDHPSTKSSTARSRAWTPPPRPTPKPPPPPQRARRRAYPCAAAPASSRQGGVSARQMQPRRVRLAQLLRSVSRCRVFEHISQPTHRAPDGQIRRHRTV